MSTQPASEMERGAIALQVLYLWTSAAPGERSLAIADFILAREAELFRIAAPQVEADRLRSYVEEG